VRAKPTQSAGRGGGWFELADVKVHLGVERNFRPATKAQVALAVDGLRQLAATISAASFQVVEGEPLDGIDRMITFDPFGNRIELMKPTSGHL
jgi:hypothetical protein